jgi:sodium pump decarboxylase gamma subunit
MGLGEIFKTALLYTLTGMGTVFCVLMFISVCIWLLGLACGPKKEKEAAAEKPAAAAEAAEGIRPEVVAAVTAAIHQHLKEEGTEEGYVVRNVRRATWRHTS